MDISLISAAHAHVEGFQMLFLIVLVWDGREHFVTSEKPGTWLLAEEL